MALYSGIYPSRLYVPEPWQNTWVPKHFPEHHHAFEHTRHSISHGVHQAGHELAQPFHDHSWLSPRVDTRESKTTYYVDVELPGLEDEEKLEMRWISSRTLLVKAVVERKGTPEDADVGPKAEDDNKEPAKSSKTGEQAVYLTLGERHIGLYGRALNFPVDVDHDKTTARLTAGVLRLTVPKVEAGRHVDKTVTVENDGK